MLESDVSFRVLDLNLLRVFDAMVTEGSVAGAAARLSITPSAVSHALGRLRALFNDPLFIRASGGMRATPRALEVGGKVREGLRYLEGALTPADFVAAESRRTFTMACSAYVSAVLLPAVIAQVRERAPCAHLAVAPWSPDAVERFSAGKIDVLAGDFLRVPAGCDARLLFEDGLAWLMGRDYVLPGGAPDAGRARVAAAATRLPRRTALEGGFERRLGCDEGCCIVANPVDGAAEAPLLESLPYALIAPLVVKQADFAALLPRRLAEIFARELRLDIVEPAETVPEQIRISAVCHPEYGRRAPVVWFRDLLVEAAERLGEKVTGEKPHALPR